MSSRLFQEIREKRGLVYAIHSFAHSYRDGGLFGIYAGTGEEEAAELVPVLCDEAMRLEDGLAPGRAGPRQGADEGRALDVARKHRGALRADGAAHADPRHAVRSGRDRAPHRGGRRRRDRAASSPAGAARRRPWRRSGRSAGSRISTGCGPGSAPERSPTTHGGATQDPNFPRLFLARSEPFRLVGDRVFLRPPERGDYEEWASLRARSRGFLAPWEPTWPPDALSRVELPRAAVPLCRGLAHRPGLQFLHLRATTTRR